MKCAPVGIMALAGLLLAGCQTSMTLEQAQAACDKQGGLLVIIYTEKITRSTVGPVIASPGNCVSPSRFDKETSSATPGAGAQTAPSATSTAPVAPSVATPGAAPASVN